MMLNPLSRRRRPVPSGFGPILAPFLCLLLSLALSLPGSPAEAKKKNRKKAPEAQSVEDLQIVDCLLPGQVRQLGRQASFVTARRPIRTTASDCEIRGGEYVAYDRSSYASALAVWLPAAEAGDPAAQTYVGEIFEKGLAATPDHAAAATWYRKAADQGYSRGEINLAYLYEQGLGVPQDRKTALELYRRAAGISEAIVLDQQKEVEDLRSQVEAAAGEAQELRRQLEATEESLDAASSELDRARKEAEELRRSLEEARRAQASQEAAAARLESLTAELEKRQARVARQSEEVDGIRARLATYRERMARIESDAQAGSAQTAPPSIEFVRPDVLTTRGPALVRVPPGARTLEVAGKVTAPAGLGSLTLDERPIEADDGGFFRAEVAIGEGTEVTVVATDRQGKRARAVLVLASGGGASGASPPAADRRLRERLSRLATGKNHALIISASDYQHLPRLRTAEADGEEVRRVLEERYGFQVRLLENPTSVEIFLELDAIRRELGSEENLLIYYAGHGKIDDGGGRGFWIPTDGEAEDDRRWIPNEAISDMLDIIPARHVLVVADSCYSGTMTRSSVARLESDLPADQQQQRFETISGKRSRTVLTSGGLQPVLDQGGGGHSLFARAFLNVLEQNQDVLLGVDLHREVAARVRFRGRALGVDQRPDYSPIRYAGHEAGDFAFIPR